MNNEKKKDIKMGLFLIIEVSLFLVGLLTAIIGLILELNELFWGTILLSIGTSLMASSIATVYLKVYENHKDREMDDKFSEIKLLLKNSSPENRVHFGRHLKNVFLDMLEDYKYKDMIHIDVIGLELYHFYNEQFHNLEKYRQKKIRLIVQNPCGHCFENIIYNEGRNYNTIVKNIVNLTDKIKEYNENNDKSKIELYWIDYPSSITITRVEDSMYVRPRFLKEGEGDDDIFFEKYTTEDKRNFNVYMNYFEHAIENAKNPFINDNKLLEMAKKLLPKEE